MPAAPTGLRAIRVCGYRAFPNPVEVRLDGRSLVLYGERSDATAPLRMGASGCWDGSSAVSADPSWGRARRLA